MRIRAGWWLYAVLAYLGWLLATLPLAPLVQGAREAGVALQLQGETGTLWRGEALRLVVAGFSLGNPNWSFAPTALLRGRLAWDLSFRDADGAAIGRLAIGPGGRLELRELSGKLAARRIGPLLPMRPGLAGDLVLDAVTLHLRQGLPVAAHGQVRWLEAVLTSPMPFVIGAAEVELQTADGDAGIQGVYQAAGPDLELRGQLSTTAAGYRTESLLTPRQPQLANWLQSMGLARVGNAYRFVQEGSW
ncbi:MAG: type II secretion system protein N [Gammaproteobacteria bacterium]|nr:type II secretion system protein N [Gammaproteobacteria bacterium]